MSLDAREIAQVCHEANRALQALHGDPAPSPAWGDAPDWQRDSAVEGVEHALNGASPEELHESWCDVKRRDGWVYGPVKDADAKTHPCLVAYDLLPVEQKVKDHLFAGIVSALTADSSARPRVRISGPLRRRKVVVDGIPLPGVRGVSVAEHVEDPCQVVHLEIITDDAQVAPPTGWGR